MNQKAARIRGGFSIHVPGPGRRHAGLCWGIQSCFQRRAWKDDGKLITTFLNRLRKLTDNKNGGNIHERVRYQFRRSHIGSD